MNKQLCSRSVPCEADLHRQVHTVFSVCVYVCAEGVHSAVSLSSHDSSVRFCSFFPPVRTLRTIFFPYIHCFFSCGLTAKRGGIDRCCCPTAAHDSSLLVLSISSVADQCYSFSFICCCFLLFHLLRPHSASSLVVSIPKNIIKWFHTSCGCCCLDSLPCTVEKKRGSTLLLLWCTPCGLTLLRTSTFLLLHRLSIRLLWLLLRSFFFFLRNRRHAHTHIHTHQNA